MKPILYLICASLPFACTTKSPTTKPATDPTSINTPSIEMNAQSSDNPNALFGRDSNYKFLGFSEDLKYAAFAAADIKRSEGMVGIYEVDTNKPVNDPVYTPFSAVVHGAEDIIEKEERLSRPQLTKYNITGNNIGTSYHIDEDSQVEIPFDGKIYKLKLITKSAADANKYFELQVLTDSEPIVLHADAEVPKVRGKVVRYEVVAFYMLEDKVVGFVEFIDVEGESKVMMVTGLLK